MENLTQYLNDITAKDESKALNAAKYLLDSANIELFKMLTNKTKYLFDFIKENVSKRISMSANSSNYKNVINFFEIYSSDFDDVFAQVLGQYANEELTDELLDLLENGTNSQKQYASKYFVYIPDTIAAEILKEYSFSDIENLSFNSAQALGKMNDEISYKFALEKLKSEDDFEKLKAVKFFVGYAHLAPIDEIFEAMKSSSMPENIAGEIPYLASLSSMLQSEKQKNALITIDNILSGLGEILPLSQVFQFELYEVLEQLIQLNKEENHYKSKISQILLKALSKFETICKNDEYTFDEDKNTKQELNDIYKLLNDQTPSFWNEQKKSILQELTHCKHRILSALEVIKEIKLTAAAQEIKKLLNNENEIVVCESISTLKELNSLEGLDKNEILKSIKCENIRAIIDNYWR